MYTNSSPKSLSGTHFLAIFVFFIVYKKYFLFNPFLNCFFFGVRCEASESNKTKQHSSILCTRRLNVCFDLCGAGQLPKKKNGIYKLTHIQPASASARPPCALVAPESTYCARATRQTDTQHICEMMCFNARQPNKFRYNSLAGQNQERGFNFR